MDDWTTGGPCHDLEALSKSRGTRDDEQRVSGDLTACQVLLEQPEACMCSLHEYPSIWASEVLSLSSPGWAVTDEGCGITRIWTSAFLRRICLYRRQ